MEIRATFLNNGSQRGQRVSPVFQWDRDQDSELMPLQVRSIPVCGLVRCVQMAPSESSTLEICTERIALIPEEPHSGSSIGDMAGTIVFVSLSA